MRDEINRNNVIAEDNVNLTGHPGTERYKRWSNELRDRTEYLNSDEECPCKEPMSDAERERRIDEMDEVIKENLNR